MWLSRLFYIFIYSHIFIRAALVISEEEEVQNIYIATGTGPADTVEIWTHSYAALETGEKFGRINLAAVGSGASQRALVGSVDCKKNPISWMCNGETSRSNLGMGGGLFADQFYIEHKESKPQLLPSMAGSVVFVYGNDVFGNANKPLNLSIPIAAGIFNCSIRRWNDPLIKAQNPDLDLPDADISVWIRSDSSGMTETLTSVFDLYVPEWPGQGKTPAIWKESAQSAGNAPCHNGTLSQTGVLFGVIRQPYSIGYVDLAYATLSKAVISSASIYNEETGEAVEASVESVTKYMNATYDTFDERLADPRNVTKLQGYPFARYIYWYLLLAGNETCQKAQYIKEFILDSYTYAFAESAQLQGYVVAPQLVKDIVKKKLEDFSCLYKGEIYLIDSFLSRKAWQKYFLLGTICAGIFLLTLIYMFANVKKVRRILLSLFFSSSIIAFGFAGEFLSLYAAIAIAWESQLDPTIDRTIVYAYWLLAAVSIWISGFCIYLRFKSLRQGQWLAKQMGVHEKERLIPAAPDKSATEPMSLNRSCGISVSMKDKGPDLHDCFKKLKIDIYKVDCDVKLTTVGFLQAIFEDLPSIIMTTWLIFHNKVPLTLLRGGSVIFKVFLFGLYCARVIGLTEKVAFRTSLKGLSKLAVARNTALATMPLANYPNAVGIMSESMREPLLDGETIEMETFSTSSDAETQKGYTSSVDNQSNLILQFVEALLEEECSRTLDRCDQAIKDGCFTIESFSKISERVNL